LEDCFVVEWIASLPVGFLAGLLSSLFPSQTGFVAIRFAGVLDLWQGFCLVYSMVEVMGKHFVDGADLLEGFRILPLAGIDLRSLSRSYHRMLYRVLLVPAAALPWSGLSNPEYRDLPWMMFHSAFAF
jgi:uncharacterized membrane protein YjjB (DUF3815 family)